MPGTAFLAPAQNLYTTSARIQGTEPDPDLSNNEDILRRTSDGGPLMVHDIPTVGTVGLAILATLLGLLGAAYVHRS